MTNDSDSRIHHPYSCIIMSSRARARDKKRESNDESGIYT